MPNAEDWQTRLSLSYAPSAFQSAIFEWVERGRGHGVVEAVAGSGKTTTIVSAARLIAGSGLFVAFNKVIADMLQRKLVGTEMVSSTVHSHGFAAIREHVTGRVKVDAKKYQTALRDIERSATQYSRFLGRALLAAERTSIEDDGFARTSVLKLLDLCRLSLVRPDTADFEVELLSLADHHDLDFPTAQQTLVVETVRELMFFGWDHPSTIDFTDMVWLPNVNGYAPTTYSWVFVDEAQDISRAHLDLIRRSLRPGGRALFVGDPRQAIYGFAGADSDSFARIVESTRATVLPLSVCYRCPTSVLDLAREICPQIEARDNAPAGAVRKCTRDGFVAEAQEGDMVLCRVNAPLLGLCFGLIAEGVSAAVRGRDIGKGLTKVVTDCSRRLLDFADFGSRLDAWEDGQVSAARQRYRDADVVAQKIEYIEDQAECIRIVHARSRAASSGDLNDAIQVLFADDKPSVVLSSVHRAKGLEAPRVFIAAPERLGCARPGAQPWMAEQEQNLRYVAITRAMAELIEIVETVDDPQQTPKAVAA